MNENRILQRLRLLRTRMQEEKIQYYLIPTADFHLSEYVSDYFKTREYMSGFTGSAGTLLIGMESAGLWTDGRYYLQADRELAGSTISLFKQGMKGVPDPQEYLREVLVPGDCLGFDGRVVSAEQGEKLCTIAAAAGAQLRTTRDLAGEIWPDRPSLPEGKVWILEECYTGETAADKLARLRARMQRQGAEVHVLTLLDDIAWLCNLRGSDIACTPVFLSYAAVTPQEAFLFIERGKLDEEVFSCLSESGFTVLPYDGFYTWLSALPAGTMVMLDRENVNYAVIQALTQCACIDCINPTQQMKACKNAVEIRNLTAAHIRDGVAVTRFIRWVKENSGRMRMTELSASAYLEECRRAQEGYLGPSFDTICAYGANAAMMHYSAGPDSNAVIRPEGMLLVDSGGQYYEGTTDITRTIVLGPLSDEVKKQYTAVLKGMLALADAKFLYGCSGMNLDILAREPLWEMDIDYRCGTGHGVGYLLSVHEPPNSIRWRQLSSRSGQAVFEEGMLTSDEPGVYAAGSHGIRLENLLLCKKAQENEYGQFMCFSHITMAPLDLDGVDVSALSAADIRRLNSYHEQVYASLSPHLTQEERQWLSRQTRPVG